ncbi:hypothetical protein QNM99_14200 [Pseudomonas sp. PCH446]
MNEGCLLDIQGESEVENDGLFQQRPDELLGRLQFCQHLLNVVPGMATGDQALAQGAALCLGASISHEGK